MKCKYELLLVNDGSKDGTLQVMRQLSQQDENVTSISFSRNFGKEAAIYAGFCNANGDYVAVMDADMQNPPSLLPEMLKILEYGLCLGVMGQYIAKTYIEAKTTFTVLRLP